MAAICSAAGVAQSTPSRWRGGASAPTFSTLRKLEGALSRIIADRDTVHTAADRAAQCPASPGNGSDFTENQETAGDDLSLVAAPGGGETGVGPARPVPVSQGQEAA
ncbi:MAG: hypothetical protein E2598_07615 [Sphingobium sp.]|nr:hypothetical protein [Sphingobium sp.]